MEALRLKICHFLYCESHIHLSDLSEANAKSKKRTHVWTRRGVITCHNCMNAIANAKRRHRDGCLYMKYILTIPIGQILNKIVNLCIGGKRFANLLTFT